MQKPRLSFWQIFNMSFGFLGIQFGWGLQLANMSAIYSYLGAKESEQLINWGYTISDRCIRAHYNVAAIQNKAAPAWPYPASPLT